jgi:Cellulase (glycosyl hydrolase family 5)
MPQAPNVTKPIRVPSWPLARMLPFMQGRRFTFGRLRTAVLAAVLSACALLAGGAAPALASKTMWSIFEDHPYVVQTDPATRQATLDEIQRLGADTLRVEIKWNEVAPNSYSRKRPRFNATDPSAYPGFGPYDSTVQSATARGMRVLITLTGDSPRWATSGGRGGNYKPNAGDYARFVTAAAKRYSGRFGGLPKVSYFTLWNEPNHVQFIKPTSQAPIVYRALVNAGLPALRRAAPGAKVFVGELKPSPRKGYGPLKFMQRWLCLDGKFKRLRGRAARKLGCRHFKKVKADGFAMHPYGPVGLVSGKKDIINLLAIKRLAKALDRAARAGRLRGHLPIYNTEFGIQTNPPDIFVSTTPGRQARLINEKEEYAYRYSRLKSHSQYQLYDDPGRPGPAAVKWSGFQTGLRFANHTAKPSLDAYSFPIVVHKRGGRVSIWGRVRPGKGTRYVQLQRQSGSRFVDSGGRIGTNSLGYFSARPSAGNYRFLAYARDATTGASQLTLLGNSRTATPIP